MGKFWGELIARFIGGLISAFVARLKRDKEKHDEGFEHAIEKAHTEADQRLDEANAAAADYDALDPAAVERLRESRGHYRD